MHSRSTTHIHTHPPRHVHASTHKPTNYPPTPGSVTDLLPLQVGHCVPQVEEAVLDVVTALALQSVVMGPFVRVLQQEGRESRGLCYVVLALGQQVWQ